jgi:hypothetical protein
MSDMDFLENSTFSPSKPFAEPAALAQKPLAGPFYFRELAGALPLGVDTIGENYAPAAPIRHDPYNEQAIEPSRKPALAGTAPTQGIYTGVGGYE